MAEDSLSVYNQGRNLDVAGRVGEAKAKYEVALKLSNSEISANANNSNPYVVKAWSLFRLNRHAEVISTGTAALQKINDYRIYEVIGESYFFLEDLTKSLEYLQRYIERAPENADRVATAYFYMAEVYLKLKKLSHADIAYTTALYRDPGSARWWYRQGLVSEQLGNLAKANDAYGNALKRNPGYKEAQGAQARVRAKLNP